MGSISEEFKDQKINDLLEDYILLEKQISLIPNELRESLKGIELAVSHLPESLNESINVIAAAVEDSEKTAEKLNSEFQESLKIQYETILSKFNSEISNSIKDNIASVNSELKSIEIKIKSSSKHLISNGAKITNMMLAAALCFTTLISIVFIATIWVNSKQEADNLKKYGNYWYESQKIGLQGLSEAEQKKFKQAIDNAEKAGLL